VLSYVIYTPPSPHPTLSLKPLAYLCIVHSTVWSGTWHLRWLYISHWRCDVCQCQYANKNKCKNVLLLLM